MSTFCLYFVRHAPVINPDGIAYGRDIAVDLSCSGLFNEAAARLPKDCPDWYVSQYPRAVATAATLHKAIGIRQMMTVDACFNEQNFGHLTDMRKKDIENTRDPEIRFYLNNRSQFRPPYGESVPQMIVRVQEGLARVARDLTMAERTEAVVVCHGGVIRAMHAIVTGRPFNIDAKVPYLSVHRFDL